MSEITRTRNRREFLSNHDLNVKGKERKLKTMESRDSKLFRIFGSIEEGDRTEISLFLEKMQSRYKKERDEERLFREKTYDYRSFYPPTRII